VESGPVDHESAESGPVESGAGGSVRRRRARVALVAGVGVAAVLGAVTLAASLPSGGTHEDGERPAAAVSAEGRRTDAGATTASAAPVSPSSSRDRDRDGKDDGKGLADGKDGAERAGAPGAVSASPAHGAGGRRGASLADPLTVTVSPYTWQSPCSQRYLIDKQPGEVPPPPAEQDATAWVATSGAVSSGEQYLTLTVQGTGAETVVVNSLKVRTVHKRSPLAWNDYAMGYPGVGCGGDVPTRSFTVALDAMRPAVVPEAGHKNFPFTVSENDPEVYYVRADASAYDVSWVLVLEWSSGTRRGTVKIDDRGRPFRTSGNNGRPAYEFPLGGDGWVRAGASTGP
jgi:hypothetical protein